MHFMPAIQLNSPRYSQYEQVRGKEWAGGITFASGPRLIKAPYVRGGRVSRRGRMLRPVPDHKAYFTSTPFCRLPPPWALAKLPLSFFLMREATI